MQGKEESFVLRNLDSNAWSIRFHGQLYLKNFRLSSFKYQGVDAKKHVKSIAIKDKKNSSSKSIVASIGIDGEPSKISNKTLATVECDSGQLKLIVKWDKDTFGYELQRNLRFCMIEVSNDSRGAIQMALQRDSPLTDYSLDTAIPLDLPFGFQGDVYMKPGRITVPPQSSYKFGESEPRKEYSLPQLAGDHGLKSADVCTSATVGEVKIALVTHPERSEYVKQLKQPLREELKNLQELLQTYNNEKKDAKERLKAAIEIATLLKKPVLPSEYKDPIIERDEPHDRHESRCKTAKNDYRIEMDKNVKQPAIDRVQELNREIGETKDPFRRVTVSTRLYFLLKDDEGHPGYLIPANPRGNGK